MMDEDDEPYDYETICELPIKPPPHLKSPPSPSRPPMPIPSSPPPAPPRTPSTLPRPSKNFFGSNHKEKDNHKEKGNHKNKSHGKDKPAAKESEKTKLVAKESVTTTLPRKDRPLPPTPNEMRKFAGTRSELCQHELDQLTAAIKLDVKIENCQTERCQRQHDVICMKCHHVICYKCSRTEECKKSSDHHHVTQDFDEYLENSKQKFEIWRAGKTNEAIDLDHEIREISLEIKNAGQKLAYTQLASVPECTRETITELTQKLAAIDQRKKAVKDMFYVLEVYDARVQELSDMGFIKLCTDLFITDSTKRCKKFNLGSYDTLQVRTCEHVAIAPDSNRVMASTNDPVEIFDTTRVTSVTTVSFGGHVNGFQCYKNYIYVSIDLINRGDRISVFDQQFVESSKWLVDIKVCDLAVSNEKVYLASTEAKIHVYSTHGTPLYVLTEGCGTRIACHPTPDILLVTNHDNDRLYALNGDTKKVLWEAEVDKPWGVAIDEYETIWVWSEFNQGLSLFDDKGNKKNDIEHPKLTGIGDVNSICAKNGKLWVAYDGGMHRFQIGYS